MSNQRATPPASSGKWEWTPPPGFLGIRRHPETPREAVLFCEVLDRDYRQALVENRAPGAVFIDTLGIWLGGRTEGGTNDYDEMNKLADSLSGLHELMEWGRTALIVTHHSKKGSRSDTMEAALGSRALAALSGHNVLLTKTEGDAGSTYKLFIEGRHGESTKVGYEYADGQIKPCGIPTQGAGADLDNAILEALDEGLDSMASISRYLEGEPWNRQANKRPDAGHEEGRQIGIRGGH